MLDSPGLRSALHSLMRRGADASLPGAEFNQLARAIFHHQFELNAPYRRYCERRGRTPANVTDWTGIPPVPTAAFKEVALVAGRPDDAPVVFRTSGTTRGAERRGLHYLLDPALYEASLLATFHRFVLRDQASMRILSLIPPFDEQRDSSLSYMASTVVRELGGDDSGFFADARNGVDVAALRSVLEQAAADDTPVCLLGTSLAFAHVIEALGGATLDLPGGSRLMDTGGFKGEKRTYDTSELRAMYRATFGMPQHMCINEYGMTELCSQYYDFRLEEGLAVKAGPPWLRARVLDPDTLAPLPRGETGILQHFDLANLDSVSAVLTEDLGMEVDDGFVLLGRVPNATPRGCSIAMDLLLSHPRGE